MVSDALTSPSRMADSARSWARCTWFTSHHASITEQMEVTFGLSPAKRRRKAAREPRQPPVRQTQRGAGRRTCGEGSRRPPESRPARRQRARDGPTARAWDPCAGCAVRAFGLSASPSPARRMRCSIPIASSGCNALA
eukprot:7005961-Prymnesium_polylepis.1